MMRLGRWCPIVILLLVGGCGTVPRWTKPGATPERFLQDRLECERLAGVGRDASGRPVPGLKGSARSLETDRETNPLASVDRLRRFEACMELRGYRRVDR